MLRQPNQLGREVITASEERLRARLDEVKVWLNTARFIAGNKLQDSAKRAYATGLFRYFLMLKISTEAALFQKLRSKQEKEAREKAFSISIELHSLPSEKERERLRKESIRLQEYADCCDYKRWNDGRCYNRVIGWSFDFAYIAIALSAIGMNPNDDLMPSEYQLKNFPDPKAEHPQPAQPIETDGQSSLNVQSELVVSPEIPQHPGSMLPGLSEKSESVGVPTPVVTTVGAPKRLGGRPKHAATVRCNELAARAVKLSTFETCKRFDEEKVSLPKVLLSPDNASGSWIVAYGKNRQKVEGWFREKRRKPRARGKLKKG